MIHFDRVSFFAKAIGAKVSARVLRKLYIDVKAENDELKRGLEKCVRLLDALETENFHLDYLLAALAQDTYKSVVEEARKLL